MGRYDKLNTEKKNGRGRVYESNLLPYIKPADDDILIITEEGDRLDLLANLFYGDATLWWVIATYNNLTDIDIQLQGGIQLRVPQFSTSVTDKI